MDKTRFKTVMVVHGGGASTEYHLMAVETIVLPLTRNIDDGLSARVVGVLADLMNEGDE